MEMGKMAVEVLEPYDLEILDADEKAVGKDFVKKAKEGGKTDVVALLAVLLCEDENAETFVGILPGRIQSLNEVAAVATDSHVSVLHKAMQNN